MIKDVINNRELLVIVIVSFWQLYLQDQRAVTYLCLSQLWTSNSKSTTNIPWMVKNSMPWSENSQLTEILWGGLYIYGFQMQKV